MKEQPLHNRKYLKDYRKQLRNNGTPAEATLWKALQRKQLKGRKFRRQHSIGNYIVDFYCPAEKLAVELDGAGHFTSAGYLRDKERDRYLAEQGVTVIRFENIEVFKSLEALLEQIASHFRERNSEPASTAG